MSGKTKTSNQRGSVSIEASIALTAFLFMFLMIYSIINICRAQAILGNALNNSAKEISQYSYLYGLTGLDESFKTLAKNGNVAGDNVNELIGDVNETLNAIQSLGGTIADAKNTNLSDPKSVADQWDNLVTAAEDGTAAINSSAGKLKEDLTALSDDPKGLMIGLARLFASKVIDAGVSHMIADPVARTLVKKNLKRSEDDDPNSFLHDMGVYTAQSGKNAYLDSLDFSDSTIFANGSSDIILMVRYQVQLVPLLPIDQKITLVQSAATKGWLHGDGEKLAAYEGGQGGSGSAEPQPAKKTKRPTWQQSELDLQKDYPGYEQKISFKKMPDGTYEKVPYGTTGSVRPDLYKDGHCVDVSNYTVTTESGRKSLVYNVKKKYLSRLQNMPPGTKQTAVIDVRGQEISEQEMEEMKSGILKATDNGVEVIFKKD